MGTAAGSAWASAPLSGSVEDLKPGRLPWGWLAWPGGCRGTQCDLPSRDRRQRSRLEPRCPDGSCSEQEAGGLGALGSRAVEAGCGPEGEGGGGRPHHQNPWPWPKGGSVSKLG